MNDILPSTCFLYIHEYTNNENTQPNFLLNMYTTAAIAPGLYPINSKAEELSNICHLCQQSISVSKSLDWNKLSEFIAVGIMKCLEITG